MQKSLSLSTLGDLDFGKVDIATKKLIEKAVRDCLDRPGDEGARTVTLSFSMVPVLESNGECEVVNLECSATCKVPPHRSKVYPMQPTKSGDLLFQPLSPDNPHQMALGD